MRPICLICGRLSKETDHLSYDNYGCEPSLWLQPVCDRCHDVISKLTNYSHCDHFAEVFCLCVAVWAGSAAFDISRDAIMESFSNPNMINNLIRELATTISEEDKMQMNADLKIVGLEAALLACPDKILQASVIIRYQAAKNAY